MNRREQVTLNVAQSLGWYHGCVTVDRGPGGLGSGPCSFCTEQAQHAVRAVAARPTPMHPAGKARRLTT